MKIDVMVFNDNTEEVFKGKADIPQDGMSHNVVLRTVSEEILSDFYAQLTRTEKKVRCYIGKREYRICFTGHIITSGCVDFSTPQSFWTGKFVKTPWEMTRMEVG